MEEAVDGAFALITHLEERATDQRNRKDTDMVYKFGYVDY